MKPQADFFAFFSEMLTRFSSKQPAFFKVITWVTSIIAFITIIPVWMTQLGIHLPPAVEEIANQVVGYAFLAAAFVSKLTVAGKPIEVTVGGNVVKVTDSSKLPFTAKKETQAIKKTEGQQ